MASFFIPLTGLESDSTALNTIANDLSNMNTTAFKAETTNFSDLFYQQIGSTGAGDPIQVGAGVQVASNETAYLTGLDQFDRQFDRCGLEREWIFCGQQWAKPGIHPSR